MVKHKMLNGDEDRQTPQASHNTSDSKATLFNSFGFTYLFIFWHWKKTIWL